MSARKLKAKTALERAHEQVKELEEHDFMLQPRHDPGDARVARLAAEVRRTLSAHGKGGKKPRPKTIVAYDWSDIDKYIKAKYTRNLRDWEGRWEQRWRPPGLETRPYHDFWHWLVDYYGIHNGAVTDFGPAATLEHSGADLEPWVVEILTILRDEFGDEFKLWTVW